MLAWLSGWIRPSDPVVLTEEEYGMLNFDVPDEDFIIKNCNGRITKVGTDHLILDNEYLYLYQRKGGFLENFEEGDEVDYQLQRSRESEQWQVAEIRRSFEGEWVDDIPVKRLPSGHQTECTEIGKISAIHNDDKIAVVEIKTKMSVSSYQFDVQKFNMPFLPMKGDFVTLSILVDGTDLDDLSNATIVGVKSLRVMKDIAAVVVEWDKAEQKGILISKNESKISITKEVFAGKHCRMNVDGLVLVSCVECEPSKWNKHCGWRAFKVKDTDGSGFSKDRQELDETLSVGALWSTNGVSLSGPKRLASYFGKMKILKISVKSSSQHVSSLQSVSPTFEGTLKVSSSEIFPISILPGAEVSIEVEVTPHSYGLTIYLLRFEFSQEGQGFVIGYKLEVNVDCDSEVKSFSENYKSGKCASFVGELNQVIPAQRKRCLSRRPFVKSDYRRNHDVPRDLRELAVQSPILLTSAHSVLCEDLQRINYVEKFKCLIHLEEIANEVQMEEYDQREVTFSKAGPFLRLEVEGLAEKRPSLMLGDSVIAKRSLSSQPIMYEGSIHEVHSKFVMLMFQQAFHSNYLGETYDVRFKFNRSHFKRQHQVVVDCFQNIPDALFPEKIEQKEPFLNISTEESGLESKVSKTIFAEIEIKWFNQSLNEQQRYAVQNVLKGEARPFPYIIFGPPGTGKTVTVIEALAQLFTLSQHSRILVATPSNSAADLIVERLHHLGILKFGDLARLNAFQRPFQAIPPLVQPYSYPNDDLDMVRKVTRHRIIVSTCASSGGLYKLNLSQDHFTHCFIDEAGETTEPESMIPIGLGASHIILAGDPKQLGPILLSRIASQHGLETSYLERLSKSLLYRRDVVKFKTSRGYNPKLITKLIRNYRSNCDIIRISSDRFYDGELIPLASPEIQKKYCGTEFLPNKDCPLLFHGIKGSNYQEPDSPSWFNPHEAYQAAAYLQKLLNIGASPSEIGIISPYRKQTKKIRIIIERMGLPIVKIGSVEEFQGQERDVIIISTTRSASHLFALDGDASRGLGFLRNYKRFNVSLTRAKSMLIVIGDPDLLRNDDSWASFLNFCARKGACTGYLPEEFENEGGNTKIATIDKS